MLFAHLWKYTVNWDLLTTIYENDLLVIVKPSGMQERVNISYLRITNEKQLLTGLIQIR
jgi:hypothetical protein